MLPSKIEVEAKFFAFEELFVLKVLWGDAQIFLDQTRGGILYELGWLE